MKKVVFYLDNQNISKIDCTNILEGNPGIGGTECMIVTIACLLSLRDNGIEVFLLTSAKGIFPSFVKNICCDNISEAILYAEKWNADYFVFKHDVTHIKSGVLNVFAGHLKLIPWCHVFMSYWELDAYAQNPAIYKIINVGREVTDLYLDHKAYLKSSYIYNCVNLDGVEDLVRKNPYEKRNHVVTYVGCLVPYKGFHLLAEAWPKILKKIPDAQLYVIGTGSLYNKNSKMGPRHIAEEKYEDLLMTYLSKDGEILPSVHFMGVLGAEKKNILLQTKVGIPNPSGITETFCISAVEMQMFGAKVTSIKYPGYLDTIKNGILYKRRNDLAENVVRLLSDNQTSYNETLSYFQNNFSYEVVVKRWESFFQTGILPKDVHLCNVMFRFKWIKLGLKKIKEVFPFLYKVPHLERIYLFFERFLYGKITYLDS